MISFQQLIRDAQKDSTPEADRSMDLRVEFKTHGKKVHLWKLALKLYRHLKVIGGDTTVFMTLDGEEIVDDLSDDDGEYWHSLDWKNESQQDEGHAL